MNCIVCNKKITDFDDFTGLPCNERGIPTHEKCLRDEK